MPATPPEAKAVIDALGLGPHPEGGWYAETFRDAPGAGGRPLSTAILFLLAAGEASVWHRVRDTAELWHFHAGAPLDLGLTEREGLPVTRIRLGADLAAGEQPQAAIPAGWWQAARSSGAWTLVGCTVAPGFLFSSFELAPAGWTPDGQAFPGA